jgi:cytochrome c6
MISGSRRHEVFCNIRNAAIAIFVLLAVGSVARAQTAASSTDTAASTFKSKCAGCHGADGAGTTLGTRLHAPDLRSKEVQGQTPAALAQVITAGKNSMPAFGNRLDSDQIQKLVAYVRTFHADAAAPK